MQTMKPFTGAEMTFKVTQGHWQWHSLIIVNHNHNNEFIERRLQCNTDQRRITVHA